uniref:isocitrate dehydrogenase (NAD(+)) n=1 Tax=Schistosoma haematobium TaxID=6185 RepID=A0A094ZJS7_SCHHA
MKLLITMFVWLVKENIEVEYSGIEYVIADSVVQDIKWFSEEPRRCVTRFAFQCVKDNDRHSVIAVHKAIIMRISDGLLLQVCREEFYDMLWILSA